VPEHEIQKLAARMLADPNATEVERVLATECIKLYTQRSMWYGVYNKVEDEYHALAERVAELSETVKPVLEQIERARDKF
jgi:hypothetical protein